MAQVFSGVNAATCTCFLFVSLMVTAALSQICPSYQPVPNLSKEYCVSNASVKTTFNEAKAACEAMCSSCDLAILSNKTIHDAVALWFYEVEQRSYTNYAAWIGLVSENASPYSWVDGTPFEYEAWGTAGDVSLSQPGECLAAELYNKFFARKWREKACPEMSRYICQAIKCDKSALPTVRNATADQNSNNFVGAVVTYQCDQGFQLPDGRSSISVTCLNNGLWSDLQVDKCLELIKCSKSAIPTVLNATIDQTSNHSVGAVVTYECDQGFQLPDGKSSISITCLNNGLWSELQVDKCLAFVEPSEGLPVGAIIGIVIGGLLLVIIIVAVVVVLKRRKSDKRPESELQESREQTEKLRE